MTCPYCGETVADLETHLREAFRPKNPNAQLGFQMTRGPLAGQWFPIQETR